MCIQRYHRQSIGLLCFLAVCFSNLIVGVAFAQTEKADRAIEPLPLEITPEGVQALAGAGVPFVLLNADLPGRSHIDANSPVRLIYYTVGPSYRSAQHLVAQNRSSRPAVPLEIVKHSTQRMTGTPLDWQAARLNFDQNPLPEKPLSLTPRQLSDSTKDGVDMMVLDLRPTLSAEEVSPFPNALRLMPHQVEDGLTKLSKKRWVILIDGGGRVAWPIAERLFQQGYLLTAVLEGGYPAWVEAVDR